MTNLFNDGSIAEEVLYIENWLRAEYRLRPKFSGLLTLMNNSAYAQIEGSQKHMRRSYGMIPTIYYSAFKNFDMRFFLAYIAGILPNQIMRLSALMHRITIRM